MATTKKTTKKTMKKTTTSLSGMLGSVGGSTNSFNYQPYTPSSQVTAAQSRLQEIDASKPQSYNSEWQDRITNQTNAYLNRDKFNYDFNTDALYKQYRDNYTKQANMSMQNTMAQAATMTGGYGNSYAATAGNLAFQGEMGNLNNIIPQLYEQAYNKYQDEGNTMLNGINLMQQNEDSAYGKYRDTVGDWKNDRSYYDTAYNNERNFDYGKFTDARGMDFNIWQANNANDQDARNFAYQQQQDAITNDMNERQFLASLAKASKSGGSGGSGSGTSSASSKKTTIPKSVLDNLAELEQDSQEKVAKDLGIDKSNVLSYEEFCRVIQSSPKLQKIGGYQDYLKWKRKHPKESNTI